MKKNLLQIIFIALVAGFVSCSEDLPVDPGKFPGQREIRFMISTKMPNDIITRATGTTFEIGDSIGIYIVKRNDPALPSIPISENNYASNVKWVKTDNGWEPATMKDKLVYPEDGSKLDFYAYYPYDAMAVNPLEIAFSVKSDQSSLVNFTTSDLMLASNTTGMEMGPVSLVFAHQMSWIEVEMKGDVLSGVIPEVLLVGLFPEVIIDFGHNIDLQASGSSKFITMNKVSGESNIYRALIPAQRIIAGRPLFRCIIGGVTYRYSADETIVLNQREKKFFEITLQ